MPDDHPFLVAIRRQQAIEDTACALIAGVVLLGLHLAGIL